MCFLNMDFPSKVYRNMFKIDVFPTMCVVPTQAVAGTTTVRRRHAGMRRLKNRSLGSSKGRPRQQRSLSLPP